jgi:hypothetical protein
MTKDYSRGFDLGLAAAREVVAEHGKVLAENNLRDLELHARRTRASFDRGYATGYRVGLGR